ncbi:MAG: hypothetical protein GKR95_07860 [Gammaproteobacteria bacterium]|nr:hypothetical protein [Gammaproteobacteria bacterium]
MSKLIALLSFGLCFAINAVADESDSLIDFGSVDEAYQVLSADQSATMTNFEGWIIYNKKHNGIYTLWSFTPLSHPAHPSVVRRDITNQESGLFISMSALCESEKTHCDALIEDFREINENLRKKHSGG